MMCLCLALSLPPSLAHAPALALLSVGAMLTHPGRIGGHCFIQRRTCGQAGPSYDLRLHLRLILYFLDFVQLQPRRTDGSLGKPTRKCFVDRTTGALGSKCPRSSTSSGSSKLLGIDRVSEKPRRSLWRCNSTWSCASRRRESLLPWVLWRPGAASSFSWATSTALMSRMRRRVRGSSGWLASFLAFVIGAWAGSEGGSWKGLVDKCQLSPESFQA